MAVPTDWLKVVQRQCEGRSPSFLLTMIINGMVRPWEVLHGGTSAYTGTYLEPVINALKSEWLGDAVCLVHELLGGVVVVVVVVVVLGGGDKLTEEREAK